MQKSLARYLGDPKIESYNREAKEKKSRNDKSQINIKGAYRMKIEKFRGKKIFITGWKLEV